MCIATIAAISSVAGAGIGAAGAIQQGNAQAQSANYQAQVAANNATIARQNAQYSASATAARTQQEEMKAAQQNAAVRAAGAANNLDVDSGSPLDVQIGQRELGKLDTETVANQGAQQVYGYKTQATDYTAQSALDRQTANNDVTGGYLKGFSSLLSAAPDLPPAFGWMGGNKVIDDGTWAE